MIIVYLQYFRRTGGYEPSVRTVFLCNLMNPPRIGKNRLENQKRQFKFHYPIQQSYPRMAVLSFILQNYDDMYISNSII